MNRATHAMGATISAILASAGLEHGISQTMQGSAPSEGWIIQAIGPPSGCGTTAAKMLLACCLPIARPALPSSA